MGIKHFFIWYKKHFGETIKNIAHNERTEHVDNLCIDMNGIFHPCAQKIYSYGDFKKPKSLLIQKIKTGVKYRLKLFKEVCDRIDFYRELVRPTKRIILCVDGVAGNAKMTQQRQRRFKSSMGDELVNDFDPVCLTPGTQIMDFMTKYIDWYVKSMQTMHPEWRDLEVIVSNEKVPGEGEHKIINYMRRYAKRDESYCIQGLDADLIMLSLGLRMPKMYILRENIRARGMYHVLDISRFEVMLVDYMKWEGDTFNSENCINDFILMCFMVGNDFIPTIPTLAILEGGIDIMLDIYKTMKMHLTYGGDMIQLNTDTMKTFFKELSVREKELLEDKQDRREQFFEDHLLNKYTKRDRDRRSRVDMEGYRKAYYKKHFDGCSVKGVCHTYLEGMQWVINYYKIGIPDWRWQYNYFYAPFLCDLAEHTSTYINCDFVKHEPVEPFMQLLCVLPPSSKDLLPTALQSILYHNSCKKFYPDTFDIDVSGKRREWEGIVKLPFIHYNTIYKEYVIKKRQIKYNEAARNKFGVNFLYKYSSDEYQFKSYYGNIARCRSKTYIIIF